MQLPAGEVVPLLDKARQPWETAEQVAIDLDVAPDRVRPPGEGLDPVDRMHAAQAAHRRHSFHQRYRAGAQADQAAGEIGWEMLWTRLAQWRWADRFGAQGSLTCMARAR